MSTPKNMRAQNFPLKNGGAVHTYTNDELILLQIRHSTPTEDDVLQPSYKVAVSLTPAEALAIAGELVTAVSHQIKEYLPKTDPNS